MSSTKKTKKIKYGKVEISSDEFDTRRAKFRVTMFIDLDVIDEIRKHANKRGLPYQTYINQLLRGIVFENVDEKRIRQIVREELANK